MKYWVKNLTKERPPTIKKSSPSLKHYVVPSPKTITEVENKDSACTEVKPGIIKEYVFQDFKGNICTDSSMDRQAVLYEYSPLCTISKSLPVFQYSRILHPNKDSQS